MMRDLLGVVVTAAGLLLPGLGWARAQRWPLPWFAAGVLSALAIFSGVLACTLAGVPLRLLPLALWLLAIGLPGWWRACRRPRPASARIEWFPRADWLLAWPAALLLAVAGWRALVQPLSGPDAVFRWNELAQLMVERGSLDFYPAASSEAFTHYFWADGIAPLVASLYAWSYWAAGDAAPVRTAVPVLLQTGGLLALLWALGRRWGGPRGGAFACALAGGTMLLQFAFNLGQETGLTALGAGGMIFYLLRWRDSGEWTLLIPAAACAALAACAREYGAVAAMAGAGWIACERRGWRPVAGFVLGAAFLPAWWHARVAWLTGNPLFPQRIAGWPTNPVFDLWLAHYRTLYGFGAPVATLREIGRLVLLTALPAVLGLLCGLIFERRRSERLLIAAVAALFGAAWLASIPFTAGGLFYSMRVLSPVLLLGCAAGGGLLARAVPGRRYLAAAMLGLGLFAIDASLRAWTMPGNPYALAPRDWPAAGDSIRTDFEREDRAFLEQVAGRVTGRLLSDSAGLRSVFQAAGKTYSPLWTPEVAWLFADGPKPGAADRLRALGFSHLLIKRTEVSSDFLQQHGVLAALAGRSRIVLANPSYVLIELLPPGGSR